MAMLNHVTNVTYFTHHLCGYMACSHESMTPNCKVHVVTYIPPFTFILSPGRGNLCNLCICNIYVNLNLCWCADDVQLLAQISSCSGRGAWTRSPRILPLKIHLAGQVFQRFLLGHGYMERRANMRVTMYGGRHVCGSCIQRWVDVLRVLCELVTLYTF